MELIFTEKIKLSPNEDKAIELVLAVMGGIQRAATDPHLRNAADAVIGGLYEVFDHLEQEEE